MIPKLKNFSSPFGLTLMILLIYVYLKVFFNILPQKKSYQKKKKDWKNCSSEFLDTTPLSIRQYYSVNFPYTCRNLFDKKLSEDEKKYIKIFRNNYPRLMKKDSDFVELSRDCNKLKSLGYISTISEEEKEFPLAFNLIVHENSEQVERQLRALWRPNNIFCIHVDKSSSKVFHDAINGISSCFENVHVVYPSIDVVYAGFTRLLADIKCMEILLERKSNWKYLINTAGTAFPLLTNLEMTKVLRVYNGANDIEGLFDRPIKSRFEEEFVEVYKGTKSEVKKTGKKNPPPPDGIQIVRGSAYGVFSRKFVDFVIHNEKASHLLDWSKKTYSPDEHYWATLNHLYANPHLNTPGGYKGIPHKKPWLAVFAGWGGEYECKGKWQRGVCVFSVSDLAVITKKKHFFVNKFEVDYDSYALDCFEAWLKAKVFCQPDFDLEYYQSLPFAIS